jgi:integrase
MATGKVTIDAVKKLAASARDAFLWDTDCRGFGVKCTPAGKKVYVIQYRMHGGRAAKVQRYTIGTHGTFTPDAARKEAERLLRMVAQGTDPAGEKHRMRTEANELAFSTYADLFLKLEVKKTWPRAYDFVESALRLHAKPRLKNTPLPQIGPQRLTRFFDDLPDKPGLRRNVFAVLRRMFRWAKGRGDIPSNPMVDFDGPPAPASRDRWLNEDDLTTFLKATGNLSSPFGPYCRLLLILGQRRNEVSDMDWRELDRTNRDWIIPPARSKNKVEHLVALSDYAIAELDALAGGEKWPKRGNVFTTNDETPISGFSKLKKKIDKEMLDVAKEYDPHADIDRWRLHDLRRSAATHMQRLGIPNEHIEAVQNRLAGRSKPGAGKAYLLYEFEPEKRRALDKWGAFLASLLADKNNVVPLAKAG